MSGGAIPACTEGQAKCASVLTYLLLTKQILLLKGKASSPETAALNILSYLMQEGIF